MPKTIVYYSLPSCVACRWCSENSNFTIFVDWDEHTYEILKRLSINCLEFGQSKQCPYLMNHFVSIRGRHFYLLIFHLFPNSKIPSLQTTCICNATTGCVCKRKIYSEKPISILCKMDAICFYHLGKKVLIITFLNLVHGICLGKKVISYILT